MKMALYDPFKKICEKFQLNIQLNIPIFI